MNCESARIFVNTLSCDEATTHFKGIVSVLPVAINCARKTHVHIKKTKSYLKKWNTFTISDELRKLTEYNDSESVLVVFRFK